MAGQSKLLQIEMASVQKQLAREKSGPRFPTKQPNNSRRQSLTPEEWAILDTLKRQSAGMEALFGGQRKRA